MIPGDLKLGLLGSEILLPSGSRKVTPNPVEEGATKRTASKKLVEEIIRRYVNIQIDYENMIGEDHETLEMLYSLNKNLNLVSMDRLGVETSTIVKMTWTPGTREFVFGGWLWSGVSISLEVI
jgi:hypothetical protein